MNASLTFSTILKAARTLLDTPRWVKKFGLSNLVRTPTEAVALTYAKTYLVSRVSALTTCTMARSAVTLFKNILKAPNSTRTESSTSAAS